MPKAAEPPADQSLIDAMNNVSDYFGNPEPEVRNDGKPPRDQDPPSAPVEEPKQTDDKKSPRTDNRSGKQIRLDGKAALERLPVVEGELESVRRELLELKGQNWPERVQQLTSREAELAKKLEERNKWYVNNHKARLDPDSDETLKGHRDSILKSISLPGLRTDDDRPTRVNVMALRNDPNVLATQNKAIELFAQAQISGDQKANDTAVKLFISTLPGVNPENVAKFNMIEDALLNTVEPLKEIVRIRQEYQKNGSRIAKERYEGRLSQFKKDFGAPLMDQKAALAKLAVDNTDTEAIVASLVPGLPEDIREKAQAMIHADAEALSLLDIENLYTPPLDSDNQAEIEAHAANVQRSQARLNQMLRRNRFSIWAEAMLPTIFREMAALRARVDKESKKRSVTARTEQSDGAREITTDELKSQLDEIPDSYDLRR